MVFKYIFNPNAGAKHYILENYKMKYHKEGLLFYLIEI